MVWYSHLGMEPKGLLSHQACLLPPGCRSWELSSAQPGWAACGGQLGVPLMARGFGVHGLLACILSWQNSTWVATVQHVS